MIRYIISALMVVGLAQGQTVVPQPAQFNYVVQVLPGAVPTSLTCVIGFSNTCIFKLTQNSTSAPGGSSADPYVCGGDIEAAGQTITLQDANGVALLNNVLGSGGSVTTWFFPTPLTSKDDGCRIFPGGVYIQSSGAGATFRLIVKYNK